MIVSHEHRFVYFAMPKTGSQTVRAALEPYNDEIVRPRNETSSQRPLYPHMRPVDLAPLWRRDLPPLDEYLTFTVVRNPWERLVSLYNHLSGTRRFVWERRLGLVGRDFGHWLERDAHPDGRGAGRGGNPYRMYGSYSVPAFCSDDDGALLVDEFVVLDRLDTELHDLLAPLGVEVGSASARNVRAHAPYRSYYDDRTRHVVAQRYAWEIERFGFRF